MPARSRLRRPSESCKVLAHGSHNHCLDYIYFHTRAINYALNFECIRLRGVEIPCLIFRTREQLPTPNPVLHLLPRPEA